MLLYFLKYLQSHQSHLYLQGDDKLYVNSANTQFKMFSERSARDVGVFTESGFSWSSSTLAEGRQWLNVPVPSIYLATNWPVRVSELEIAIRNYRVMLNF